MRTDCQGNLPANLGKARDFEIGGKGAEDPIGEQKGLLCE